MNPICKKVRFATEKDAKDHITRMLGKNKKNEQEVPRKLGTYCCTLCHAWHITSVFSETSERYELEVKVLNEKIAELEQQIEQLKAQLVAKNSPEYIALLKEVKKDELVASLKKSLQDSLLTNRRLRKDNDTLISRNLKLLST